MKVALGSDLHLEIGALRGIKNREGADVLILGGDILAAKGLMGSADSKTKIEHHEFFQAVATEFPHTVMVMGNHEHYDGEFTKTADIIREFLEVFTTVHLLEKQIWEHGGVTFVGGTLWTDCNQGDPNTMWRLISAMNDYRCVTKDGVRLLPQDTVDDHAQCLEFIKQATAQSEKTYVVVGHHAPCKQSIKPRYLGDYDINGAYSSALDEFIVTRPQIRLWTHGHTHDNFDYMVGSTRVVCNPRGYVGYESRTLEWDFVYLDI
jgi:Icc-related predicted phosphoesterase